MTSFPNFFTHPEAYNRVRLGGRLLRATLVGVSGNKGKDKWTFQRSRETGNMVAVFGGSEPSEGFELTLEAVDAADFDDLRELWDLLKPTPTSSSSGASTNPNAPTNFVGSPTKAQADAAASSGTSTTASTFQEPGAAGAPKGGGQNVGPRPPTLPIENAFVNWFDVWAVARGGWEGPTPTETNSVTVKVTLVPNKPPVPAGAGAMAGARAGSGFSGGAVTPQADADGAKTRAAQAAAGT